MHFATRGQPRRWPTLVGGVWKVGLLAVAVLATLTLFATDALAAQSPVGLGTADSFAVLAGSAVTNTGPSTINGNLGVDPGTAVSGFPPGTVNGTTHAADAVAGQAESDLTVAYNDAASRTPPIAESGDLGGQTLTPGVYNSGSSIGLTGALTLNAQGNPDAVFIFQVGSTLTTASGSSVKLENGAQACNVYWQIGSSATLGTGSGFVGNILAYTSITMNNSVTVDGRALARNGDVTLIDDTITPAYCSSSGGGGSGGGGGGSGGGGGGGSGGGGSGGGGAGGGGSGGSGGSGGGTGTHHGTGVLHTTPSSVGKTIKRFGTRHCVRSTFHVSVTGHHIRRVVFSVSHRVIVTRYKAPFDALVWPGSGIRTLTARVTFTTGAHVTLRLRFRSCAAAKRVVRLPKAPSTPGGFTG